MLDGPTDPDSFTPGEYNNYVLEHIKVPFGDEEVIAMVKWRKRYTNGKTIGISNDYPLLDTRLYGVELPDGTVEELAANAIAEKLLAQCNEDGFMYQILDKIVDHRTNGQEISTYDAYIDNTSVRKLRKTTIGWELCFQWRDEEKSRVNLKDLKESYLLEVSEYAVANKILEEPALSWWDKITPKRRNHTINAIKYR